MHHIFVSSSLVYSAPKRLLQIHRGCTFQPHKLLTPAGIVIVIPSMLLLIFIWHPSLDVSVGSYARSNISGSASHGGSSCATESSPNTTWHVEHDIVFPKQFALVSFRRTRHEIFSLSHLYIKAVIVMRYFNMHCSHAGVWALHIHLFLYWFWKRYEPFRKDFRFWVQIFLRQRFIQPQQIFWHSSLYSASENFWLW